MRMRGPTLFIFPLKAAARCIPSPLSHASHLSSELHSSTLMTHIHDANSLMIASMPSYTTCA